MPTARSTVHSLLSTVQSPRSTVVHTHICTRGGRKSGHISHINLAFYVSRNTPVPEHGHWEHVRELPARIAAVLLSCLLVKLIVSFLVRPREYVSKYLRTYKSWWKRKYKSHIQPVFAGMGGDSSTEIYGVARKVAIGGQPKNIGHRHRTRCDLEEKTGSRQAPSAPVVLRRRRAKLSI